MSDIKPTVVKLNSSERERWNNSKDFYFMSAEKIYNEILDALNQYTYKNGLYPRFITIDKELKDTLELNYATNRFTSPYCPDKRTIFGVDCQFIPNRDYDYIVE